MIPPWSEVCPACLSRRRVLSRLMDFVKPYKWQAIFGFSLALTGMIMDLIRPGLTKPMLNVGLNADHKHSGGNWPVLLFYIGLMAALIVLSALTRARRKSASWPSWAPPSAATSAIAPTSTCTN